MSVYNLGTSHEIKKVGLTGSTLTYGTVAYAQVGEFIGLAPLFLLTMTTLHLNQSPCTLNDCKFPF